MQAKIFLLAITASLSLQAFSQDFKKEYELYKKENNKVAIDSLLRKWEVSSPENADMLIAYFNYWADRSRMQIGTFNKNNASSFQINDINDTGEKLKVVYDTAILGKGMDYIGKGIRLYPKRLDMRYGKIYMLGEAKLYKDFTEEILATIDYAHTIQYDWQWEDGKPLPDAKNSFLASMQDYTAILYKAGDDMLLPDMRGISERILKYEPDHVPSLSNIAFTYAVSGDYDNAIVYLLKAEKVSPADINILKNLAEMYRRKNDTANATSYYNKIILYGNDAEKQYAEDKMNKMQ